MKKFESIMERFAKKLDDYIRDPNEENIHDIRIAIRRIESAHIILPKKLRKKQEIQDYMAEIKMLFKINTQIRDFDIISEKLERHGTSKYSELVNYLKNKREIELKQAHRLANKLKNKPLPKIKKKDIVEPKLNKRFQKVFTKLIIEIQQNIPVVINDEKKIEELHKLRKDFKKLRYSIELTSDKITSTSVKSLKKIQDSLGEVHDCDIMLDYLREVKGPNELSEVIRNEILERREKYQKFVQSIHDEESNPEDLILQF
ncbi:MAG: CHAD domain-containing protein [Nitrosotalea sp.]